MRATFVCLVLALAPVLAQPTIPDTPAGKTLRAWLEAFNSGDRGRVEEFARKYEGGKMENVDRNMELRNMSGGFELLGVDKSEPLHIEFRVKERASAVVAQGSMDVKDGDPAEIAGFALRAGAPEDGPAPAPVTLDAAARSRVIDGATAMLKQFYVFPDVAAKMETAVRDHQKRGDYDKVTGGMQFADLLTEHLREISHDKHLRVGFSARPLPIRNPGENPEDAARYRRQMERINCGFEKAELLAGNIGYLKFNMFADPAVCGATATAAMNFLSNADAIIFDLRGNGGGDPAMIALISTYLFDDHTHLNDLYERNNDKTTQWWTLPFVPGKKLSGKPVYVLTSQRTFSGAEEFSYNLKNLKRATIIGETTGGGAHPVSGHRIDDHFTIGVPFARAVNPISKTNWEGTGVEPDVKVPAAGALETARKMAQEKLAKK